MRHSITLTLVVLAIAGCPSPKQAAPPQPSAALSTIVATPSTGVVADGQTQALITVVVRDSAGVVLGGQTASLSVTGTTNTLSTPAVTDAQGQTTATLTSTTVETKTISATVGTVTLTQQATVEFVPGPATQLAFQVQPSNVAAGASIQPSVQVAIEDAEGHVTGSPATVTVALAGGSSGATLGGAASEPAVAGIASFQALTIDVTGTGYTLAASSTGLTAATSTPFNVTAGGEVRLVFTAQPSAVAAGASFTPSIQVSIEDSSGNVVSSATDAITLSLFSGPVGAALAGTTTVDASSGVATFTGVSIPLAGAAYALTATASGLTSATSSLFSVGAAPPSQLVFVVQPSSAQAGAAIAPSIEVAVEDMLGNPVLTASSSITLALASPAGATLSGGVTLSAAEGLATFTGLSVNLPGTYTLSALSGTLSGASTSFTITTGPPASLVFTVQPTNVVAGVAIAPSVQATLNDALGNTIMTTTPITLALGARGAASAVLSGTLTQNAVAGVASFPDLSINAAGMGCTLAATASGYAGAASSTFNVAAASATLATVTVTPASVAADGTTTTITVIVNDAFANPVPGQTVSLSVSGSANTLGQGSGTTNATGTFTTTLSSTTAETKTVTATSGVATGTAQVTFTAGTPSTATLTAVPATAPADGISMSTLTLTVTDVHGNLVNTPPVTFSVSGSANILAPVSAGQGTVVETLASTVAESKTVTAIIGTGATALSATSVVTFQAGAPFQGTSSLTATPTTVPADGTSKSTVTLFVKDANGNAVSGQGVSLSATGSGSTLTQAAQTTGANGELTATLVSTAAQPVTVTAVAGEVTLTTLVTFVPGVFSAMTSSLSANPVLVTADGIELSTLTIAVADAEGNPLAGQPIELSVSGSGNLMTPSSGVLTSTGTFTAMLSSTVAQAKTITAFVPGGEVTGNVTFVAGLPAVAQSTLGANPASFATGATSAIRLEILDANQNPVSGESVTLSASGTGNTFGGAGATFTGNTNAIGVLTTSLTSTTAQTETVAATLANQTTPFLTTPVTVTAVPQLFEVAITASPATIPADGSSTTTLSVSVESLTGTPVSGEPVTLTGSGTGNIFAAAGVSPGTTISGQTNAQGIFTATLASTVAQSEVVTATAGQSSAATGVVFTPGAPSAHQSTLIASGTQPVVADGTSTYTLTLTARDSHGNPASGLATQMKGGAPNDVFAPASVSGSSVAVGSTGADGTFVATVTAEVAGTQTITAYFGGIQLTASIAFVAGAASASCSSISWTNSSSPVTANGQAPADLTVSVAHQFCNPVSGALVSLSTNPSVASNVFSPPSQSTGANGQAMATLASTQPGVQTVVGSIGSFQVQTSVTFVAPAPVQNQSTLSASPASVAVNGGTTVLTATLLDSFGAPVASYSRVCISDAFGLTSSCGTTNASGAFSVSFSPSTCRTGSDTVTAAVTGASTFNLTTGLTLVGGAATAAASTFTTSSKTEVVGQTATLTLTLKDSCGNLSPGQPVGFTGANPLDIATPSNGTTNASGVLTTQFGSGALGAQTATATFGGASLSVQVSFTPPACAFSEPESVSLVSQPDQPSVGTATALVTGDFNGDGVPDLAAAAGYGGIQVMLGGGKGAFSQSVSFDSQDYPVDLAVGDFNKDGKIDLVSGTYAEQFDILLGNGAGSFSVTNSYSVASMDPFSITTADFNNDGNLDLAGISGDSEIVLWLGNGDGTFHSGTLYTVNTTATPTRIAAGDFNGDHDVDLIAIINGSMNVFLGNGNGTFQAPLVDTATRLTNDRFAVGDFNGDTKLDYLAYSNTGCGAVLGLGNGNGTFNDGGPHFVTSPCGGSFSVFAADVNLDTKLDAVVVSDGSASYVYFGNGNGTFQGDGSGVPVTVALDPGGPAAIADYNGDTYPDVAGMESILKVFLGSGPGDSFKGVGAAPVYTTALSPISVATGDFNKDGKPDVVVGGKSTGLDVLLGNGDGTMGTAVAVANAVSAYSLAVADVNKDTNPDVVFGTDTGIGVLLGEGNGSFQAEVGYSGGSAMNAVVVADVNKDLILDIIAANGSGDGITVWLGQGGGVFGAANSFSIGAATSGVGVGDFNGDGLLDVAVGNDSANKVSLLFGAGNGMFAYQGEINAPLSSGAQLVVADFNGDGKLDIAVSAAVANTGCCGGEPGQPTADTEVVLSNGNGTFQSPLYFTGPPTGSPTAMAAADINRDGVVDLALAWSGNQGSVSFGTGTGAFYSPLTYLSGASADGIAIADFNADGWPDLVVANSGENDVGIYLAVPVCW